MTEIEQIKQVNRRFNRELQRYMDGKMSSNEKLHLGKPAGIMKLFLPDLPIVMRQGVITKGVHKKHNVALEALLDMPSWLSFPVFVFQRDKNTIGVLTEMKDRDGKNVCVATEMNKSVQEGSAVLEVNNVSSFHGREVKYVVLPIIRNGTLRWVDKKKALAWFSSASQPVRQEITPQELLLATKIVENFENPKPVAMDSRARKQFPKPKKTHGPKL